MNRSIVGKWLRRSLIFAAGAVSTLGAVAFLYRDMYFMVSIDPESRYPMVMTTLDLQSCLALAASGRPASMPDVCVPADLDKRNELLSAERHSRAAQQ